VQQERRIPSGRRHDGIDGVLLPKRRRRAVADPRRAWCRRSGGLAEPQHPATLLELAHVVAPPWRERRERGFVRRVTCLERSHHLPQAVGARRQWRQLAGPRRGAQRPPLLRLERGAARPQRCRQGSGDHFAGRVPVIVRRPAQQLEQRRLDDRRVVDDRDGGAQLRVRQG
jgi:hypothetical protein